MKTTKESNTTNESMDGSYNVSQRIVWSTIDGENGNTTWKQHAFIDTIRTVMYSDADYIGAKTLCSNKGASEDGETFLPVSEIESEEIKDGCCKSCLKIHKSRYGG